uniref:Uncharacterized protein LOC114333069 n=1 Tax=Diabrotica virgifera virgifera TaxID=50390 RepID=A0A6P7FQZ9_DIAVI
MGVVTKAHIHEYNMFKNKDLSDWIALIKVKKLNFKCQRRKNLFIEAVLNKALTSAESELRQKQQERRQRWQNLKSELGLNRNESCDRPWPTQSCEELEKDIDSFLSKLKVVNSHIQR